MCQTLEVSESGYYAWKRRPLSQRAQADAALTSRIQQVHQASHQIYGSRRIQAELAEVSPTRRYTLAGPAVLLQAEHVQAMSMVIHELATNAGKYGALTSAEGTLAVAWDTPLGGGLRLTWTEAGGPPVRPPERQGFGSRLIVQLGRQLDGEVAFDWRPEGLRVTMDLGLTGAPAAG